MASALWEVAVVDSRQRARTTRRRPLKKAAHLPTAEAVGSWFRAYGSQVKQARGWDDQYADGRWGGRTGMAAVVSDPGATHG